MDKNESGTCKVVFELADNNSNPEHQHPPAICRTYPLNLCISPSSSLASSGPGQQNNLRQTRFSTFLESTFHHIGLFIADHPLPIVFAVLLFTAVCSLKIPFTQQEDDIKTGYTPKGARSVAEAELYEQFYGRGSEYIEPVSLVVFLTARDGGSMLRETHLNESVWLLDQLGGNYPLVGQTFYQFCTHFCQINEPIKAFRNGLIVEKGLGGEQQSDVDNYRINLTFPFISILGRNLDMSPHFFGLKTFENEAEQREAHSPTNIKFLNLIILQFRAERPENVTKEEVMQWEREIAHYLHNNYKGQHVRPLFLSLTMVADEIVRTGMTLFPYLSVGFAIMSCFSISTVWLSAYYFNQWSKYKVWMALSACLCPLLATSTALGFLFWFGFRFGTILAVSPFLVMAIGVDDAFIMIHSWQRVCVDRVQLKLSSTPTMADSLRSRIAEVLVDIGPSITITSLTNILAFVVGIFSPTPEIQLFCAGNAMALFFDYIYQLFLFTSTVAIAGRMEMQLENSARNKNTNSKHENITRRGLKKLLTRFMANYCRWVADGFTATFLFLMLLVYWTMSFQATMDIKPNITPKKLFLADSLINEMNALRDTYILPNYTSISVFLNQVGDLSQPTRNSRVRQLVEEFEMLPNNLGPQFSHFWLRDYDRFMESLEEETDPSMTYHKSGMKTFLRWPEYSHWNGFMSFNNESRLEKFFVIFAFHGNELVDWDKREKQLNLWRGIADKYSDLEAWVWVDEAQFLDQIQTLIPSTVQSSLATLVCMMVVCFVFMSNLFTVIVATMSIVSICIGVFGFLSMWGIGLDPISMATTIMSIGFSVDFPAHITYHYHRCGQESANKIAPKQRIYNSLIAIGFPLFQCGLSTILFVLCLLFVDTYMSEVFVKTMVLVVSLGLLHGLFIVPTMLCALSTAYDLIADMKKKAKECMKKMELNASTTRNNWMPRKGRIADEMNIAKIRIPAST